MSAPPWVGPEETGGDPGTSHGYPGAPRAFTGIDGLPCSYILKVLGFRGQHFLQTMQGCYTRVLLVRTYFIRTLKLRLRPMF